MFSSDYYFYNTHSLQHTYLSLPSLFIYLSDSPFLPLYLSPSPSLSHSPSLTLSLSSLHTVFMFIPYLSHATLCNIEVPRLFSSISLSRNRSSKFLSLTMYVGHFPHYVFPLLLLRWILFLQEELYYFFQYPDYFFHKSFEPQYSHVLSKLLNFLIYFVGFEFVPSIWKRHTAIFLIPEFPTHDIDTNSVENFISFSLIVNYIFVFNAYEGFQSQ